MISIYQVRIFRTDSSMEQMRGVKPPSQPCLLYTSAPELELSHGYCDFFLLPDLTHYEAKHSYIIELKMLPKKDFNVITKGESKTKAELQWDEAVEQINRYAAAPRVEVLRQGTQLHKIIMQFEGWELKNMKEV